MKKIYIRAGMLPTELFTPQEMITRNVLGNNVGNLIYQYGIIRSLTTPDTEFMASRYKNKLSDAEIDQINNECSAHILPFADAFRPDFVDELRQITSNIKRFNMPTVIAGVGIRAPYEPNLNQGFKFDDAVKEFVKAVLDKSAIIGVRGQITADYLTKLGFKEGRDHTVIGCPSMYSNGREFEIRETVINENSKFSFNTTSASAANIQQFIINNAASFNDSTYIPQLVAELNLLHTGKEFISRAHSSYPSTITGKFHLEDRVKFFLNAPSWMNFMKSVDLSFGTRLHGNIVATMSGTPVILIPKDARTREIASYHNLTVIEGGLKLDPSEKLLDYVEKLDFQSPIKVQKENFDHFIDFLDANGLDHAYKEDRNAKHLELDRQIKNCSHRAEASSLYKSVDAREVMRRLEPINALDFSKENVFKDNFNQIKSQHDELNLSDKERKTLLKNDSNSIKTLEKELAEVEQKLSKNQTKLEELSALISAPNIEEKSDGKVL